MTIWSAPGAAFEASLTWTLSGLTGTIGVRIIDTPSGSTFLARTTAGIVENPAGSGLYYYSGVAAPTTLGTYSIIWDDGSVAPGHTAVEDLIVTSSAFSNPAPTGADLCTLADVRSFIQKEAADTAQDAQIQVLITAISAQIQEWCCREFAPASTGITRRVKVDSTLVDLAPYDLRATTAVSLNPETTSPTALASGVDFMLEPLNGATGGTYLHLRLSGATSLSSTTQQNFGYALVDVTGDWGFASIPADVKQACVEAVAIRLRRDVSAFSTTFNLDESRMERPEALPASVCKALYQYKRMVL